MLSAVKPIYLNVVFRVWGTSTSLGIPCPVRNKALNVPNILVLDAVLLRKEFMDHPAFSSRYSFDLRLTVAR